MFKFKNNTIITFIINCFRTFTGILFIGLFLGLIVIICLGLVITLILGIVLFIFLIFWLIYSLLTQNFYTFFCLLTTISIVLLFVAISESTLKLDREAKSY